MGKFIQFKMRSAGHIYVNPALVSSIGINGDWVVLHLAGHNLGITVKGSLEDVINKLISDDNYAKPAPAKRTRTKKDVKETL